MTARFFDQLNILLVEPVECVDDLVDLPFQGPDVGVGVRFLCSLDFVLEAGESPFRRGVTSSYHRQGPVRKARRKHGSFGD